MIPIAVLVLGGDSALRDRVAGYVRSSPDFVCVGALTADEAGVAPADGQEADVVLVLQCRVPEMAAAGLVRRLTSAPSSTRSMLLAGKGEESLAIDCLQSGAGGCLLGEVSRDELLAAIRDLHSGGAPLSSSVARALVNDLQTRAADAGPGLGRLSEREQEVLALLAQGFGYKEIGVHLGISLSTVRAHLHAVYDKLEVRTREQATSTFLRFNPSTPPVRDALAI